MRAGASKFQGFDYVCTSNPKYDVACVHSYSVKSTSRFQASMVFEGCSFIEVGHISVRLILKAVTVELIDAGIAIKQHMKRNDAEHCRVRWRCGKKVCGTIVPPSAVVKVLDKLL